MRWCFTSSLVRKKRGEENMTARRKLRKERRTAFGKYNICISKNSTLLLGYTKARLKLT